MRGWLIERERLKITHSTYLIRSLVSEFVMRNEGPPTTDCLMIIMQYLPGLSITDAQGRDLSFLPAEKIEEVLGDRQEYIKAFVGPDTYHQGNFKEARILWIKLLERVPKGGILIVRLHYEDGVEFSEGWGLVRKPTYPVSEDKSRDQHDTFVEVGLQGEGRIGLKKHKGLPDAPGVKGKDGNVYNDLPRFLQVRAAADSLGVDFEYHLMPPKKDVTLAWSFFVLLNSIPVGLILLTGFGVYGQVGIAQPSEPLIQNVALFGATVILAAMGLLPPSQVNRLWYILPFLLYLSLLIQG